MIFMEELLKIFYLKNKGLLTICSERSSAEKRALRAFILITQNAYVFSMESS